MGWQEASQESHALTGVIESIRLSARDRSSLETLLRFLLEIIKQSAVELFPWYLGLAILHIVLGMVVGPPLVERAGTQSRRGGAWHRVEWLFQPLRPGERWYWVALVNSITCAAGMYMAGSALSWTFLTGLSAVAWLFPSLTGIPLLSIIGMLLFRPAGMWFFQDSKALEGIGLKGGLLWVWGSGWAASLMLMRAYGIPISGLPLGR